MFSVFTKLCIESPGRIYFLFQVCPLKHFSILHHQPLQSPGDSILLLVFTIFFRILQVKWYIVFVFLCLNYLTFICSSFIHVVANRRMPFFAWVNNTPVCVCVCDIFLSNYWWILRYFQVFGYCKYFCNKRGSAHISSISCFHFFQLHTQKWNCWYDWSIFNFLRNLPYVFHSG